MNQKQLRKVQSLYKEGASEETCIQAIADICEKRGLSYQAVGSATLQFLNYIDANFMARDIAKKEASDA